MSFALVLSYNALILLYIWMAILAQFSQTGSRNHQGTTRKHKNATLGGGGFRVNATQQTSPSGTIARVLTNLASKSKLGRVSKNVPVAFAGQEFESLRARQNLLAPIHDL